MHDSDKRERPHPAPPDFETSDEVSARCAPAVTEEQPGERLARAKEIYLGRRKRAEIFGSGMFGEYAWDMLIILYLASERRLTIGHLARRARAPTTTALRWIDYLEAQKLIKREAHPTDRRASFISLSEKGSSLLDLYLSETLHLPT